MSLMAATIATLSAVDSDVFGRHPVRFVKVTLDNSYVAGGEPVDLRPYAPAFAPAADPIWVQISPEGATAQGYVFQYDYTNRKVIAFRQKDPAAAGGADIALPEVAAAVDLSAVVLRILAIWA